MKRSERTTNAIVFAFELVSEKLRPTYKFVSCDKDETQ